MEKFEKASKSKLRFSTNKGLLSVEDLWDLSLQSLDNIAKAVNKDLKASSEESFIEAKTTSNSVLELKLEILKHIIAVKLEEKNASAARAVRQTKLAELKALASSKQMEELGAKSLEDIQKMIAEMENE